MVVVLAQSTTTSASTPAGVVGESGSLCTQAGGVLLGAFGSRDAARTCAVPTSRLRAAKLLRGRVDVEVDVSQERDLDGAHVARGVLCLASVAAAFVFSERAFVRDLRDLRRSGAAKAE